MLKSDLFIYLHKRHCILFLRQVSNSRIPPLFIIFIGSTLLEAILQVPAYITLTLISRFCAFCFFCLDSSPQPLLTTACFLFPSRMNWVISVPDSFHHHKSDKCPSSVFFQPKEHLKQTKSNLSFNKRYGFNNKNKFPIDFRNYWKNNGYFILWPHSCIPEARIPEIKLKERSC